MIRHKWMEDSRMKEMDNLQPLEENQNEEAATTNDESSNRPEEPKPMPFGLLGISFLLNLTQYAVLVGLTMLLLMLIRIFAPE
jgi:hypothetical protein